MIRIANVQICLPYKATFSNVGDLAYNSKRIVRYKPPQSLTVVDLAVLGGVFGFNVRTSSQEPKSYQHIYVGSESAANSAADEKEVARMVDV